MLLADGLEKRYGDVEALRGFDLEVAPGQIVALLGRNGAGKSTALSIIAGLLRADSGSVTIDGVDTREHPAITSTAVGIAPQETGIYRVLTVRENLEFFGDLAGLDRVARRSRAEAVAERLGLAALLDRRATALSGGEARRLHTACALVHEPRLLLLDEPTVGADVATRNQLIEAVRQLAADGAAVVYTTHYLPEVEALDAEIVIIDNGLALTRGTRAELVAEHFESGYVVAFDGDVDPAGFGDLDGVAPEAVDPRSWHFGGELDMAVLADRLGSLAGRVVSIEATRPDLEQVFLAVTGAELDGEDDQEAAR